MEKVVIAGGSSGIGLATAALLSAKGYEVVIMGRDPAKLASAVAGLGDKVAAKALDATDREALQKGFSAIGDFQHLVIAVSGRKGMGAFRTLDLKTLREGFEEKFFAQLQVAQAALPFLTGKGSITFITAISSQSRMPGTSGLGAINGALEIMTPTLAKELKPLRVNAVSPGVINTPWWDFMSAPEKQAAFEGFTKTIPAGRIGEPKEVAALVGAVVENEYLTGQVIAVDGGIGLGQ